MIYILFSEMNTSMILSPRDAFFASKKKVRFEESIGKVCGVLGSVRFMLWNGMEWN
ncbi:putative orn/Lys/Arg decarboxylase domain superfamily [Helianthus anomalus]